jgi:flagellar basal-body rod protein FlgB
MFGIGEHIRSSGRILSAISHRQQVVSNNIANANTPGYSAQKVSFADLLGSQDSPFENSLSRKMGTLPAEEMSTGEPVNLQQELVEMQKNLLFYNMTTRRISSVITGLKSATQIGR